MALLLNTPRFNKWIPRLIESAKKELILIVPYIKISKPIFNSLKTANGKGVQIIIVYRENKLASQERDKLLSLEGVSLLHHPHIHSKCYYNGDLLIIGSMNLYQYSEENNREMGTLFHNQTIYELFPEEFLEQNEKNSQNEVDTFLFDVKEEISSVITSSTLEIASSYFQNEVFDLTIIKSEKAICTELCKRISKVFFNKNFAPKSIDGGIYHPECRNYYDRIDVLFDGYRWQIKLNEPEDTLKDIFDQWQLSYKEYEFEGFKYYWNYYTQNILLYPDWSSFPWSELTGADLINKWKEGVNSLVSKYRSISGR